MKNSSLIGFSTGCFVEWKKNFDEIIDIITSTGANSIEISFLREEELLSFECDRKTLDKIHRFDNVSIHAPDKKYITCSEDSIIRCLSEVSDTIGTRNIVVHPDSYKNWSLLKSNFNLFVENIPSENYFSSFDVKNDGHYGYVFDIFHAFESDKSWKSWKTIKSTMGNKIKEIHVSGVNNTTRHCLLSESDYRENFCDILKTLYVISPRINIIMEGKSPKSLESLEKEMTFVRKILGESK